ncbi:MAG TPA: FliH/SctL family protein [bacterium]|nr:FliH/SctL family protein [bacterium]HQL63528.1 FliH/SctL family protein [bacterium]
MSRVIKAPNVREARPMSIVNREMVLRYVEDEAQQIREQAVVEAQDMISAAQVQVDEILAEARAQAEGILAEAQAQAQGIRESAREEGMQKGDAAGRKQVRTEVAGLMADLANMLKEGRQTLEDMIVRQEREIRRLVAQIASKVVQQIIDEDHETVARIARECIRLAGDRQTLTILIHPEDHEIIEQYCPEYRVAFDNLEKIEIRDDLRVPRGGVIIETGSGGVDGRIHRQLGYIRETLVPEEPGEIEEQTLEDIPEPEE